MLQRALRLYEAYRDSAPHIRFARLAALRGKAMSICSAVAEGASGAALNLLGVMTESDIAASLENDPHLPVFKEQPELHIPVEGLTDGERFPKAFVLLDRVYNIPRGQQAYAARKVSELLMRRVVRLEGGRPCTCTAGVPFVQEELEYLRKSTERAAASELSAVAYWRARFLWDERGDGQRDAAGIRELLRQEWKRCHCPQMVEEGRLNLQAVLIAVERLALDVQAFDAAEKDRLCRLILDWFRNWPQRSRQVRFHLGTGEHLEYRDDALWRLRRFGEHLPSELVRAVEQEICP